MRRIIAILLVSAAFAMSGMSATTFFTGQLTSSVWADGAGE